VSGASPVSVALLGAGVRGRRAYGAWCLANRDRVRVVAVAEPTEERRRRLADEHAIPIDARFADWTDLLASGPPTDGVIIATPDSVHAEPAIAALALGRDVLLEKPVARTPEELDRLLAAARASAGRLTIAHPLRYAPLFESVARMVHEGRIGRLMTIDHVENVGYLHFAHSYVRGNWRRTDETAPVMLTKACHDLDLLAWLAGGAWTKVASFGSLSHFRAENAPAGAPARCIDGCPVQSVCPFDSVAFYLDPATPRDWLSAVTANQTEAGIRHALQTGPYGRCVYRSDNDVADHQVTIVVFADGATATLTVSAFTAEVTRSIRLMGSHGEITGDLLSSELVVRRFTPGTAAPATEERVGAVGDMHGGGDERMMDAFVDGLAQRSSGQRPPAPEGALEASVVGHVLAFAAEEARIAGQIVQSGDRPSSLPRLTVQTVRSSVRT
jgi:predicted dehydrogenase